VSDELEVLSLALDLPASGRRRWAGLATGLLWTAIVLIASTVYGVYDGDDVYGVANTLLPALLCLGGWRFAVWRRDR
jgi:hypothetical protein